MGDSGVGRLDLPLIDDGRVDPHEIFKVRPYQLEMLEESMKRNIIIAAETGSGKTLMYRSLMSSTTNATEHQTEQFYEFERHWSGAHSTTYVLIWCSRLGTFVSYKLFTAGLVLCSLGGPGRSAIQGHHRSVARFPSSCVIWNRQCGVVE